MNVDLKRLRVRVDNPPPYETKTRITKILLQTREMKRELEQTARAFCRRKNIEETQPVHFSVS